MAREKNSAAAKKLRKSRNGFTMVYNSFLDSEKLTQYDKMVFIAIKSFADNKTKQAFPSLATISRISGTSISQVRRSIKHMAEIGIIKVEQRSDTYNNGRLSNLYTLYDSPDMWEEDFSTEEEDFKAVAKELPDDILEHEYHRRHLNTKKEPSASTSDQTSDAESTYEDLNVIKTTNNYKVNKVESQHERYTLDQIKMLYEYHTMVNDYPDLEQDIDAVMNILYDALNTTKDTIRVAGEEKPAMVVIGRLMKLGHDEVIYCINNFGKQTGKINNQTSYMLTMLYKSAEQFHLDIKNQVQHDLFGSGE